MEKENKLYKYRISSEENKELSQEEISKMVEKIREEIEKIYPIIEEMRKRNPQREIGGYIVEGKKIEWLPEACWKENKVIGDFYQKEREKAKKGIIPFHTHPDNSPSHPSALDLLAAAYRLRELIFHKKGVTLIIAIKELPLDEIKKIDQRAWEKAQQKEEDTGDPAYWWWYSFLKEELPLKIIELMGSKKSKNAEGGT